MNRKSVAKAILEAVDDKDRDDEKKRDDEPDGIVPAPPDDIDKVVTDEPDEDPLFAPDANMTIKDQEDEPAIPSAPEPEVDARIERLADVAHGSWSGWMEYLFGKSVENEDGTVTIPAEQVQRWRRQMATPYAELADEERESDREEARKYVAAIEGPEEEPPVAPSVAPSLEKGKREPYHSLDPHDNEGEDDGW